MLVKLTTLKQIIIKLADDAKEQFSKINDEHVPENCEKSSSFVKFDQRLDTFMSQFLLNKEYESFDMIHFWYDTFDKMGKEMK